MNALQLGAAGRTIWGEARGEGPAGMAAVAHVLLNRVADGRWGPTLFDVCLAPWQFSCWNRGDPNRKLMLLLEDSDALLSQCLNAMAEAPSQPDPTGGATHYYADTMVSVPNWTVGATQTAHIGHHIFFKNVK